MSETERGRARSIAALAWLTSQWSASGAAYQIALARRLTMSAGQDGTDRPANERTDAGGHPAAS